MKRKKCIVLVMVAMMIGVLGACVKKEQSSEKTQNEETEKEGGVVKCIAQGSSAEYLQMIGEQMKEAGSPYEIEVEEVALDSIDQKINLAHASSQDYDFIMVNNSSVQQFVSANILEPLDDYVENAEVNFEENYSEALMKVGEVDGKQYAIPLGPDCRVLAYNKKLLDAAGYDAPKTQEDVMNIAKELSKDGVYAFARQMDTSLAPAYIEGCFFMGNGAYICKEEDGKVIASCDTPEMIESVKWWQEMTPYMPKDMNYSADQVREMFVQNQLLFYVFGPWDFAEIDLEYGVDYELIPTPGNVKNGVTMGGWYGGIGSGSKNKEGAKALLDVVLLPENICKMNVGLPADNRCYEIEPYNAEQYNVFVEAFKTAEPPMPITTQFNKINDIYFEYFNKALVGNEDAETTMKECNAKIQEVLDKEE